MAKAAKKQDDSVTPTTHQFDAEISNVLHLMIHALYTNRDIFLRELISNASDASDKRRFEGQKNAELLKDAGDLAITIRFDKDAHTLEIEDRGIGMNEEDLVSHLGKIAHSGTKAFLARLKEEGANSSAELIGQFGVGFYSAFMVADKVSVHTRKAGEETAWLWESNGEGSYDISPADAREVGTCITLHLKEEAEEYLDIHRLSHVVKTYSDHIAFPIMLEEGEGEPRQLNDGSAIWAKPKSEVTDEQYQEFYRHVAHSPEEPWMILHNKNEGVLEFTNLLFIPGMKPFDLFHPERKKRVKLYVKRVFITDEGVDLIPGYLRFMRGVIDSADLPLNISRETLQKNMVIQKIRETVASKVLSELKKKSEKDAESYQTFWDLFGSVLKEGLCEATEPREKILDACRFYSTQDVEKTTTLAEYKTRMKEGQKAIYYLTGDTLAALRNSPQLEGFKARGLEVLLLTDHVDDFWTNVTLQYKDVPFKSVIRAGDELDDIAKEASEDSKDKEAATENQQAIEALITAMKTLFGEEVRDVRTTKKLGQSPCCLAINEGDMDIRMERFLLEHNQLPKRMPKILELNPSHALVQQLARQIEGNTGADLSEDVADKCWLLLDQARLSEGEPLSDMSAFIRRLNAQML